MQINRTLGYYLCNGIEFTSKVNALLYSKTVNQPVQWMFHDSVFEAYPWHIEPSLTLDELYDQRARQLRERYDYLILSFSGGSDTNNILESFIRQGLHIDEIVTNHMSEATQKFTLLDPSARNSANFAAEHQLQAVPRLQYIHKHMPRTKITELDVSRNVIDSLNQFDDADWVLNRNDHLSVGQLFRYNYFHFAEIKKKFDRGQRVGIITGTDKPKLVIQQGNFYIYFVDTLINITTVNDFNKHYDNVTTEAFYWSPDCADMLCKQAHVVRRWLLANPAFIKLWINPSYMTQRLKHEKILRPIIYTTWDESWFQADKSTNWWHTEFDTWFRNNPEYARQHHLWTQGIQYLAQQLPEYIRPNEQGQADSFVLFKKHYKVAPFQLPQPGR